jgi:ketosteroid isomerase-like protein
MSIEDENVAILKEVYALWRSSKGDPQHFFAILAPDINFGSLPDGRAPLGFTKSNTGYAHVKSYFDGLAAGWKMTDYVVDEFVAQGDVVVMRGSCEWVNRETGKSVHSPKLDFWRMRDGKAIQFFEYFDTAKAAEAATP